MVFLILAVIAVIAVVILLLKNSGSNYSKTRHWTDFDPGVDTGKVGDPKYPNASMDSVMKHEMLDEVLRED